MDEYDDLETYNGDAVHDMNVDFDRLCAPARGPNFSTKPTSTNLLTT